MSTNRVVRPSSAKVVPMTTSEDNISDLLQRYGFGSTPFIGTENATYERRLVFDTATGLSVSPLARSEMAAAKLSMPICIIWVCDIRSPFG
jgi:hypothetical protein